MITRKKPPTRKILRALRLPVPVLLFVIPQGSALVVVFAVVWLPFGTKRNAALALPASRAKSIIYKIIFQKPQQTSMSIQKAPNPCDINNIHIAKQFSPAGYN
jgi:hypothetical protein